MTARSCTTAGCSSPHFAKGLCSRHWQRRYRRNTSACADCATPIWAESTRCKTCAKRHQPPTGVRGLDPAPVLAQFPGARYSDIARALGVSRHTIANWKAGRAGISLDLADRIAVQLGLHLDLLWHEDAA